MGENDFGFQRPDDIRIKGAWIGFFLPFIAKKGSKVERRREKELAFHGVGAHAWKKKVLIQETTIVSWIKTSVLNSTFLKRRRLFPSTFHPLPSQERKFSFFGSSSKRTPTSSQNIFHCSRVIAGSTSPFSQRLSVEVDTPKRTDICSCVQFACSRSLLKGESFSGGCWLDFFPDILSWSIWAIAWFNRLY